MKVSKSRWTDGFQKLFSSGFIQRIFFFLLGRSISLIARSKALSTCSDVTVSMSERPNLSSGMGHTDTFGACRHTTLVHQGVFPKIKFFTLDRVHPNSRGGDWNKDLLQLELQWIYNLRATKPPGLNDVCFKPFLEGFDSGGMEK